MMITYRVSKMVAAAWSQHADDRIYEIEVDRDEFMYEQDISEEELNRLMVEFLKVGERVQPGDALELSDFCANELWNLLSDIEDTCYGNCDNRAGAAYARAANELALLCGCFEEFVPGGIEMVNGRTRKARPDFTKDGVGYSWKGWPERFRQLDEKD